MVVVSQRALSPSKSSFPTLEIGRTEAISNTTSPRFTRRFVITSIPGFNRELRFDVYDIDAGRAGGSERVDLAQQDFAGTCSCTIDELISEAQESNQCKMLLSGGQHVKGSLTVTVNLIEEVTETM